MKKYKHMKGHGFELKTVNFLPKPHEHEKMEYHKEHHKHKECHHLKDYKNNSKPGTFIKEQFEEKEKELKKTNKVTGLWYPHKSK